MKKYNIHIVSNTGQNYYDTFQCEDIKEYLTNQSALRFNYYQFNNTIYYTQFIFKITIEEANPVIYATEESDLKKLFRQKD